jgi:hypothetical protein
MRYKEVIRAPLWLLAFVYFLFASLALSIWAAFGNSPALIALGALTLYLIYLFFKTELTIKVDEDRLYVGRAWIDRKFVGDVAALDSAQLKVIRTRDADPSAYLAIRFWAGKAVKIQIDDSRDQTPYWLVTSKRPHDLAKALKS